MQVATREYCSSKYWEAFINQTPLSAQELIQEDHYQILRTLDVVCKDRKDLTEDTKFMLEILRNTHTIEDALHTISRKLKLMKKVFGELTNSNMEFGHFAIPYLRNLDSLGLRN